MIIVPGSVNADLLFKVAKLPRPGETVLCPSYVMAPGGKGANQAAAAAKAGAEVAFVGSRRCGLGGGCRIRSVNHPPSRPWTLRPSQG